VVCDYACEVKYVCIYLDVFFVSLQNLNFLPGKTGWIRPKLNWIWLVVFGHAGLKICEFFEMIDGRWYVAVCWRGWSVLHCIMKLFQGNRLKGTNFGAWVAILCWHLNSSAPYCHLYAIPYKAFPIQHVIVFHVRYILMED